jgi:hypothetical protein
MPKKFARGQVAPMEREGRAEFKTKRRTKPTPAKVTKTPKPSTGGLQIGM